MQKRPEADDRPRMGADLYHTSSNCTSLLLGHDLVDFSTASNRTTLNNRPFRQRVFRSVEDRLIDESESPLRTLWALWACKEAAYKALASQYPGTPFAWRRYEVAADFSLVTFENHRLAARLYYPNENSVVALSVAWPSAGAAKPYEGGFDSSDFLVEFEELPSVDEEDEAKQESRMVRALLLRTINSRLQLEPGRLALTTPKVGTEKSATVPVLTLDGVPLKVPLSLSHDGRCISFTIYWKALIEVVGNG